MQNRFHFDPFFLFISLSLFSLLVFLPIRYDLEKYIIFSLTPVIVWGYLLFFSNEYKAYLVSLDISFIGYLFIGFLSYHWAVDESLIWHHAFSWLCVFNWMVIFRTVSSIKPKQVSYWFLLMLLVLVFTSLFFLFLLKGGIPVTLDFTNGWGYKIGEILGMPEKKIILNPNWVTLGLFNRVYGYNSNTVTLVFLCLIPFLLFYSSNSKTLLLIKILTLGILLYLLFVAQAKGNLILFSVLICYFCWIYKNRFRISFSVILFLLGVFCLLGFFYSSQIDTFTNVFLSTERGYMLSSSWKMFWNNSLLGIGLGNWELYGYIENVADFVLLNNPIRVNRPVNHNFYSLILSELGSIGMVLFLMPFLSICYKIWDRNNNLTYLQKASFASILMYLGGLMFYINATNQEGVFSQVTLIAFCSLGIFTSFYITRYDLSKMGKLFFLGISICCFLWFIYFRNSYSNYLEAEQYFISNPQKAISILETQEHPSFSSSHVIDRVNWRFRANFYQLLAMLYQIEGDYDKSEIFFKKALLKTPNDEILLISYAKFLLRNRGEIQQAKLHANKVYNKQNNIIEVNVLLAEIAIKEKNIELAQSFLNNVSNNHFSKLTIQKVYSLAYLASVVKLTTTQEENLRKNFINKEVLFKKQIIQLELISQQLLQSEYRFIYGKINEYLNYRGKIYLKNLSLDQHLNYLQAKLKLEAFSQITKKYVIIDQLLSIQEDQQKDLMNLILQDMARDEDMKLRRKFKESSTTISIKELQVQRNSAWLEGLSNILTEYQLAVYNQRK